MDWIIQNVKSELADNWPAFLYIFATTLFSICFLRERRAETRLMQEIGADLQRSVRIRFDHLERLIQLKSLPAGKITNSEPANRDA